MPTAPSPYFDDPGMAQAVGNLGLWIGGDPKARAERDYYGSKVLENEANAGKLRAETTFQLGRNAAQQALTPELLTSLAPQVDPKTGQQEAAVAHMLRIAPTMSVLGRMGINADDVAKALHSLTSDVYSQGQTQQDKLTAASMHGTATNEDFSGTVERANQVLAAKKAQAESVQRLQNVGSANVAGINNKGQMDRTIEGGFNLGAGDTRKFPKGGLVDKRYGVTEMTGMPTEATERGKATRDYLGGSNDQRIANVAFSAPPLEQAQRSNRTPLTVDAAKLRGVALVALGGIKGAIDNPDKPSYAAVNQDFRTQVGEQKWQDAEDAASRVLQSGRNTAEAAQVFRDHLGITPTTTITPGTGWRNYVPFVDAPPGTINYGAPAKVFAPQQPQQPQQPAAPAQPAAAQPPPPKFDPSMVLKTTNNAQGQHIYLVRDPKQGGKKVWVDQNGMAVQ